MVAETDLICQQSISTVQYHLCVNKEHNLKDFDGKDSQTPIFGSISTEISRFETVVNLSDTMPEATSRPSDDKLFPTIRSGSYSDIGTRPSMDDEHMRIDDLSVHLGSFFSCPSSFFAVFDGHGGPEAAAYLRRNAMKLFFKDSHLPEMCDIDADFLEKLLDSQRKAFLLADLALADEINSSCGTTAITALVLGRHLVISNVGDCRAVLCRKGTPVDMSHDHRPSYLPERDRVKASGGYFVDEYLNGYLSVTRALGDWDFKLSFGNTSPLIAEPDIQQVVLTEEDEFLIIGCDGIWDVISSQSAVSLVRLALRRHNDPELCARELVMEASRKHSSDNLTAMVICFSSPKPVESCPPMRRRLFFSMSEEARSRLKSLLEGN